MTAYLEEGRLIGIAQYSNWEYVPSPPKRHTRHITYRHGTPGSLILLCPGVVHGLLRFACDKAHF